MGQSIIKLGVLLSGSGRTLDNFFEYIDAGDLPAEVAVVIGSRPDALGLEKARKRGVATHCVQRKEYADSESFGDAITRLLSQYGPDLVVLAGFMHFYRVPDKYLGKVMNIHPALIPAFCGHGYYGHHVHDAVLEYGSKVSGCTVHFADNIYDHGPIIIQRTAPVLDNDTAYTLAARVFEQECIAYPEAIRLFAEGRLELHDRRVRIKPAR
jgi:phosphoribosylglycinamide formyltransferase-1